ncbi:MAG: hypothetical protein CFE38_13890 [Comamonadaceae bacterium PBBC1]|nr:MAG: hypothetical protein CFE38_13890 [Comamonadaceae bacterium PBBC1]
MIKRTQFGVALIEFTLGLGIFFVFLFAIIEFGRTMLLWNISADVTNRVARIVSVCYGQDQTNNDFKDWLKEEMVGAMTFTGQAMYYDVDSIKGEYLGNSTSWLSYEYFPIGCTQDNCEYVKVELSSIKIKINLLLFNYEIDLPRNKMTVIREMMINSTTCPYR